MASAAESSVGSIPLEFLQEQRRMLDQYAYTNANANVQPDDSHDPDPDTETNPENDNDKLNENAIAAQHECTDAPKENAAKDSGDESVAKGSTVNESVQQLTPETSPQQQQKGRRRLIPSSKSMPTAFEHVGDTQEVPSQEIRSLYTASMIEEQKSREKSNTLVESQTSTPATYLDQTQLTNRSPQTLREGDQGYVDVVKDFPVSSPSAEDVFLRDETQQGTQFRVPDLPNAPMTPALLREHSSRESQLLTSATTTKTPGFDQAFGFEQAAVAITATQLFGQTQQPSSPIPLPPSQSDPVTSRPEFEHPSSPPGLTPSSSMRPKRLHPARNEPRDEYICRAEPQDKKAALLRAQQLQRLESKGDRFESDEDEEDTQDRQRQANFRRQWSDNELETLGKLRAPARPGLRPGSARKPKGNETINLDTPETARKRWDNFLDHPAQDDEMEEEELELPELPAEDNEAIYVPQSDTETDNSADDVIQNEDDEIEYGNDNDEYDELSGNIVMSQRNSDDANEVDSANGSVVHDEEIGTAGNDNGDNEVADEWEHQGDSHRHVPQSPLRSTVRDSQLMQQQPRPAHHVMQSSSNMSFVPGSQYHGQTSQGLITLKSPPPTNSGSRVVASQPEDNDKGKSKIPSSPPVQTANSTIPDNSAEASGVRQQMLEQFQARTELTEDTSVDLPVIPESDLPDIGQSRPQTAEAVEQSEGLPALFSTARTHVSGSAQSPAKASAVESPVKRAESQQSKVSDMTPRKRAGVPHFSDIAKDKPTTTTEPSFESQALNADMDDIMNGVFTDNDKEHLRTVSSPARPRKRTRLTHSSLSLSASSSNRPAPTSRERGGIVTDDQDVAMQDKAQPAQGASSQKQANDEMDVDPGETVQDYLQSGAEDISPPAALRESPSKANKIPSLNKLSTPTIETSPKDETRVDTPDSVRKMEEAGRAAVSQLVSARSTASVKRTKPATYGRSSKRRSTATVSNVKGRFRTARAAAPEQGGSENGIEGDGQVGNAAAVVPPLPQVDQMDAPDEADVIAPRVVGPERVFALFKGTPQNFYPAAHLGGSADGMTYKIKFDDGTSTYIDTQHVRRLELRVGDVVKVDDREMRKKNWRVTGFGKMAASEEDNEFGTDVFGHTSVKVQVSHNRTSMAVSASTPADIGEIKEVLIDTVYITPTMWPQYKDRTFSPPAMGRKVNGRAETPSTRSNTPSIDTPGSRSRRAYVPSGRAKTTGVRPSHLRETSVASSLSNQSSAIFDGMAFAISYVDDSDDKAQAVRLIKRNGGTVLESGFEELFDLPHLDGPTKASPSKNSPRTQAQGNTSCTGLRLKEEYRGFRFAACISDKYSRRAKYIQALALGLPTISGRWIVHCLDETKNRTLNSSNEVALPWDKYLLPAGESVFLGGSIRSRTLSIYDASTADLTTTIAERANLLNGEGLLIVAPRKGGSAGEEKRKTYAFLTLALGAGKVKRVQDFAAAKKLIGVGEGAWKWVYADTTTFESARTEMFGGKGAHASAAVGKKRKRAANEAVVSDSEMFANDGTVKLVNDEFVIQSLILGALAED